MFSVPPFFKDIFQHLPSALLDLISWKEMIYEVGILSNRILTNKGATQVSNELKKLNIDHFELVSQLEDSTPNPHWGNKILMIYFYQIMNNSQMFLDFRLKHFSQAENKIQWSPGGLWAQMDPHFISGIRKVYRGYYFNDDSLFIKGMLESGLVKREWSEEKKNEVIEVFKKHFSNGRNERITFTMEDFQASFAKIFQTLVKNKIQLDRNFLYLGIMLVTLYLTLDELAGEYDVSSIFKDCVDHDPKKRNNSLNLFM